MKILPLLVSASLGCLAACSRPSAATAGSNGSPDAASARASNAGTPRASFRFATQTLSVPAGFAVEQVAGPPLVNRPISIAFDPQGRLYATDSSGLSERADKQIAAKPHRIVRLEDANGDGVFDRSIVFAENMMFPQGALFHEGSLYVAAPPQLWKLTDKDGDGVAEEREAWYDGKTLTGCANDLHGPYLGPDGWFYWTKGAFAQQSHTLGNGKPFSTRAAHIFRARPDGSGLEPVLTGGMDNPVGVAFTATGERVLSGTFFQIGTPGKRDGLIHAIYGGVYGKENAAVAGHPRTGDLMPIMTHMGAAAPCGSTAYRSIAFGADYTDNLFVCYFNLRTISRHQLRPDGATFTTIDNDFVTSDSADFRPTDVLEDADGSLLIVDTGGWYKICCPTSQLAKPDILGGIYRIRKTGAPKPKDPRGLEVAWSKLGPAELTAHLGDDRGYVQDRAIHELGKRGAISIESLRDALTGSNSTLVRRNAVWALSRIETPEARAVVRTALSDRDPSVIHTALQVVSLHRDREAVERLLSLLQETNRALARLAAETLGRIGEARSVPALLAAARALPNDAFTATGTPENAAERIFEHALIHALIEIGRSDELLAELSRGDNVRSTRVALVALDQMGKGRPENVTRWLGSGEARLKQTAGWLIGFHDDWGAPLTGFFQTQLARATSESDRNALQVQLAQLAKSAPIQQLLATTVSDSATPQNVRLTALRAMSRAPLREAPAAWLSAIASQLPTDEAELARECVATARALPWPRAGHAGLAASLARTGRTATLPAEVRLDALAATTPAAMNTVEPEVFDFLCAHLDARQPMLARSAAASALGKAPLSSEQQLALADTLKKVGALELPKLLPAFERAPSAAVGTRFVAALRDSPGLPGVRANMLKPVLAKYPADVQRQGDSVLAQLNADAAKQNARVDEVLAQVKGGDLRRGQAVFNSEKTACTLCHMMGHRGGRLGPDLSTIGRIRSERELLEAIMFPSATFVRGYEPVVVTTRAGEAHSGIVRQDAPEQVVLATGPETEQRIARNDITDMQPGPVSSMPPGMDAVLSKQELADLVVFLKSRQ